MKNRKLDTKYLDNDDSRCFSATHSDRQPPKAPSIRHSSTVGTSHHCHTFYLRSELHCTAPLPFKTLVYNSKDNFVIYTCLLPNFKNYGGAGRSSPVCLVHYHNFSSWASFYTSIGSSCTFVYFSIFQSALHYLIYPSPSYVSHFSSVLTDNVHRHQRLPPCLSLSVESNISLLIEMIFEEENYVFVFCNDDKRFLKRFLKRWFPKTVFGIWKQFLENTTRKLFDTFQKLFP